MLAKTFFFRSSASDPGTCMCKSILNPLHHRCKYFSFAPGIPFGFFKNVLSRESVNPWFFVTFNIIISHIFAKNSMEFLKSFRRYEGFLRQY